MLKRRTGRILITLLVITGLAGTINENPVTQKERKYAVELMKETYQDAVKASSGLSENQLNFKPSPDKWSVKECMYHIAASEKGLWKLFETTMKAPANPEKRTLIKLSDDALLSMIQDRTFKAQAPEPAQPGNTGYSTFAEALEDFKKHRMDHIKYMKKTTEELRNHVVELPVGWIDCYQLYLFIAGHSNRHTQQMNEVRFNIGMPPS